MFANATNFDLTHGSIWCFVELIIILNKFAYTSCVIRITENDENNEIERGKKNKRCVEFTAHATFFMLHPYIIVYSSESTCPQWTWYHPVPQTEVEDGFGGPYIKPSTKRYNLENN